MYDEIAANKRNSSFLVAGFFILIAILGGVIGYFYGSSLVGLIVSLIIAGIFFAVQYYSGDQLILKVTGARPATKQENAYLVNSVEALSIAAGIPVPKIFIIDDTALNAFATGRDPKHSTVVVTTGLLQKMNRVELEGVLAHEMSHIKNYDIRLMLLAVTLVGIVTLISDFFLRSVIYSGGRRDEKGSAFAIMFVIAILLRILTPIAAYLMQLAVSRQREYLADASAALLTRYPEGLASALEKIKSDNDPRIESANRATASLFISSPLRGSNGFVNNLFSTHPPLDERIKRLRSM